MFLEGILIKLIRIMIKNVKGVIMEKLLVRIIETALGQMSPQLRATIIELVKNLEATAEATKNPWDDILVMILKIALNIN